MLGLSEGVTNAEDSEVEAVQGLAVHEGLDETAPLSDGVQGFVSVEVETVELGVAPVSLDFFNTEVKLFPKNLF